MNLHEHAANPGCIEDARDQTERHQTSRALAIPDANNDAMAPSAVASAIDGEDSATEPAAVDGDAGNLATISADAPKREFIPAIRRDNRAPTPANHADGNSFEGLLSDLSTAEEQLSRHTVNPEDVTFQDGSIRFADSTLGMGEIGFHRLGNRLGAPAPYLSTLPENLQQPLLQHHWAETFETGSPVQVIGRGGLLEAVVDPSLLVLGASEVFCAVHEAVGRADLVVKNVYWLDGTTVQVELLGLDVEREVFRGDIVQAGLHVTHSLIGAQATWIEAFFFRLICSNGLRHRTCLGKKAARTRRLPADQANARELQLEQVRRLAGEEWSRLDQRLGELHKLEAQQVEVTGLFSRWLERARLSLRTLMPLLADAWRLEGGRSTMWSAVNAVTRVATHETDLPHRTRRLLSGIAGVLAFRSLHQCPHCFSFVAGAPTQDPSAASE